MRERKMDQVINNGQTDSMIVAQDCIKEIAVFSKKNRAYDNQLSVLKETELSVDQAIKSMFDLIICSFTFSLRIPRSEWKQTIISG